MSRMNEVQDVANQVSTQARHQLRHLVVTGLIATLIAMAATTITAALAQAVGFDFKITNHDETIPLSGFAIVTGLFSIVGTLMAVAFLRWSTRPAERFVRTTVALIATSLVPPFLSKASAATIIVLVILHLIAAIVMIPTMARKLRTQTD